jgi:hypothetical protein
MGVKHDTGTFLLLLGYSFALANADLNNIQLRKETFLRD